MEVGEKLSGERDNHKYYTKVRIGKTERYFYTRDEYLVWKNDKSSKKEIKNKPKKKTDIFSVIKKTIF